MRFLLFIPFVLLSVTAVRYQEFKQGYERFLELINRQARSRYGYNGKVMDLKTIFPAIPKTVDMPISCGGDGNNFCNYPDMLTIESVDMNALMHFPIKSGKCPQDYEKIPTYDCLNWAPALLETTCCIYKRPVAVADPQRRASTLCDQNTRIDAAVQGCDGNIYLFSGSLVWRVNANFELTSDEPLELMSFSMGSIINPDTRVEAAIVRGDCTLDLFTNERVGGSQSFVNIDLAKLTPMASGEVGVTAPYDNLVNKYVQAGISLSKAGVAVAHVNILFSGVDEDVSAGQQADAMIENWLIGGAHTASVSHENLDWATDYSGKPLPITAGFYEPNRDLIYIITDDNKQELWTFRRDGKKMSGTPQKLQEVLNICNPGGRLGDHGEDDDESVVVYIPLPVPPQPYPQYQQNPEA